MFCLKCGQEIKPGAKFCRNCGAPVSQQEDVRNPEVDIRLEREKPEEKKADPKQKGKKQTNKKLIIGIVAGITVAVAAGAVFVIHNHETDQQTVEADKKEDTSITKKRKADPAENKVTEETEQPEEKKKSSITDLDDDTQETEFEVDTAIHTYQIVMEDVTWLDAYKKAKAQPNGHLVTFETQEEMDYVIQRINEAGQENAIFWIGMTRNGQSQDYQWIDANGNMYGDVATGESLNGNANWLPGEPTFYDEENQKDEYYVDMFYSKSNNRWIWNDVPNDLLELIPSYSGKVGYIIETE